MFKMRNNTLLFIIAILALAFPAPGIAQEIKGFQLESDWTSGGSLKQTYPRTSMYRDLSEDDSFVTWFVLRDTWTRDTTSFPGETWFTQHFAHTTPGLLGKPRMVLHLDGLKGIVQIRINGELVTHRDSSGAFDISVGLRRFFTREKLSIWTESGVPSWSRAWLEWVNEPYIAQCKCNLIENALVLNAQFESIEESDEIEICHPDGSIELRSPSQEIIINLSDEEMESLSGQMYSLPVRIKRRGKIMDEVFCTPEVIEGNNPPVPGKLILHNYSLCFPPSMRRLGKQDISSQMWPRYYRAGVAYEVGSAFVLAGSLYALLNLAKEDEYGRTTISLTQDIRLISGTLIGIGLPLFIWGRTTLIHIRDDYNTAQTSLSLGPTSNGWGVALRF